MLKNDGNGDELEIYGCYSCGSVGGEFTEKIDGLIECHNCGESSVVEFRHALQILSALADAGALDEYGELIGNNGELDFDGDDDEY